MLTLGAVICELLMEAELKTGDKAVARLKKITKKREGELTTYDTKHPAQHNHAGRNDPIFNDPKRQILAAKMMKSHNVGATINDIRAGRTDPKKLQKYDISDNRNIGTSYNPSYAIRDAQQQMKNPKTDWISVYGRDNPEQGTNIDQTSSFHKWLNKKEK